MQWKLTAAVVETPAEKQAWPACKLHGKLACMRNDFSRSHVIISSTAFYIPSPNANIGVPVGEGTVHARSIEQNQYYGWG